MPSSPQITPTSATGRKLAPKTAVAAVAGVIVIVFAVANSQTVTVHWVLSTTRTPLIVLIAVCGLLGFAAGRLLARRGSARKAREG